MDSALGVIFVKVFGNENTNEQTNDIAISSDSTLIFVLGNTQYSQSGNDDTFLLIF